MAHEKKFKSFEDLRKESSRFIDSKFNNTESNKYLSFIEEYPWSQWCYTMKRNHHVILIVTVKAGKTCDIEMMQVGATGVNRDVKKLREIYA